MKLGQREERTGIVRELAERKQILGDAAGKLPRNRAEYMKLPVRDRMYVAEDVVKRYAPDPDRRGYDKYETPHSHRQPATAEFEPEDYPGVIVRGRVDHAVDDTTHGRITGLFIWAHAVDPAAKLTSHSVPFGGVMNGQAIISPDLNWDGTRVPLEDPAALNVIEFIDEATVGLLESVVRDHRRFVGQQAVGEIPAV
jgi:hypothetical protein